LDQSDATTYAKYVEACINVMFHNQKGLSFQSAGTSSSKQNQPVRDLSPGNDWSRVLVWYPPIGDFGGTRYAARGFIHPERPYAALQAVSSSSG
jgi:hypothetical protein